MSKPRRKGGVLNETANANIGFIAPAVVEVAPVRIANGSSDIIEFKDVDALQDWFSTHVTLSGKPYTLDRDQASAVFDQHKNALVTARAGSGKTRVIVAKIAYLVAAKQVRLSEIAAFMFNRTAAAEVNQRIGEVLVDGRSLSELDATARADQPIMVASTFHKFALDLVKLSGMRPSLISEFERDSIISTSLTAAIRESRQRIPPRERAELLKLTSSFIARAGQKYIGPQGLSRLNSDVDGYCSLHAHDPSAHLSLRTHRLAFQAYRKYLAALRAPKIDFNLLMSLAADLLKHSRELPPSESQKTPRESRTAKVSSRRRVSRFLVSFPHHHPGNSHGLPASLAVRCGRRLAGN